MVSTVIIKVFSLEGKFTSRKKHGHPFSFALLTCGNGISQYFLKHEVVFFKGKSRWHHDHSEASWVTWQLLCHRVLPKYQSNLICCYNQRLNTIQNITRGVIWFYAISIFNCVQWPQIGCWDSWWWQTKKTTKYARTKAKYISLLKRESWNIYQKSKNTNK